MVLVSVSIHEARVSSTFFGGLEASRRWKLKKIIILENIKSKELSLVFSKIVSKGLCCDKVWGISIFSPCTPIRGIYRKSLLSREFYFGKGISKALDLHTGQAYDQIKTISCQDMSFLWNSWIFFSVSWHHDNHTQYTTNCANLHPTPTSDPLAKVKLAFCTSS